MATIKKLTPAAKKPAAATPAPAAKTTTVKKPGGTVVRTTVAKPATAAPAAGVRKIEKPTTAAEAAKPEAPKYLTVAEFEEYKTLNEKLAGQILTRLDTIEMIAMGFDPKFATMADGSIALDIKGAPESMLLDWAYAFGLASWGDPKAAKKELLAQQAAGKGFEVVRTGARPGAEAAQVTKGEQTAPKKGKAAPAAAEPEAAEEEEAELEVGDVVSFTSDDGTEVQGTFKGEDEDDAANAVLELDGEELVSVPLEMLSIVSKGGAEPEEQAAEEEEEEDDEEEADITYELVMSANEATLDQIAGMVEGFDKAPFKGQPKKYRKAIIAALELTPAG